MTSIRPLRRRDLAAALTPLVAAFWEYPETVHLLPRESIRRRVLPHYLGADARDAVRFGLLLGAETNGTVVGAAACIPPEAYPVSTRRQILQALELAPTLPWSWRTAAEARRGQLANRARHRAHRAPHFYVRAIGVAPENQGTGAGSALMRALGALADERAVGTFLQTASEANVGWYAQFGYRIVDEYRPTPSWPDVWNLWRDPHPESAPL